MSTKPVPLASCDGIEQEAFETWAKFERLDMTQHPLHYLFLDGKTYAARQGWKGGIQHAIERAAITPVDMVLHCPACGEQHIDAPEDEIDMQCNTNRVPGVMWTNPPHRSHLCHACGHIWRPADVPTNGVRAITTKGKNDSAPIRPLRSTGRSGVEAVSFINPVANPQKFTGRATTHAATADNCSPPDN